MGIAGLNPHDDDAPAVQVAPERLAEFDRLMAQGGIEAVEKATEQWIEMATGAATPSVIAASATKNV